jgi:hypothetical protein
MGQYYDINRNPVVQENMNMNMNREIVSSIHTTKTKTITSKKRCSHFRSFVTQA